LQAITQRAVSSVQDSGRLARHRSHQHCPRLRRHRRTHPHRRRRRGLRCRPWAPRIRSCRPTIQTPYTPFRSLKAPPQPRSPRPCRHRRQTRHRLHRLHTNAMASCSRRIRSRATCGATSSRRSTWPSIRLQRCRPLWRRAWRATTFLRWQVRRHRRWSHRAPRAKNTTPPPLPSSASRVSWTPRWAWRCLLRT